MKHVADKVPTAEGVPDDVTFQIHEKFEARIGIAIRRMPNVKY